MGKPGMFPYLSAARKSTVKFRCYNSKLKIAGVSVAKPQVMASDLYMGITPRRHGLANLILTN
jgi:hypothetical protein